MASRREFKKDLNQVLSEIIEQCYVVQLSSDDKKSAKAEKIIDEAIKSFDQLIEKVYQKDVDSPKKHFDELRKELNTSSAKMMKEISSLK